jgi:hypothetical protein
VRIHAAAAGGFRPSNAWLQQAWQLLAQETSPQRSSGTSSSGKAAAKPPAAQPVAYGPDVSAAVVEAAYASVISMQYSCKHLTTAFGAVPLGVASCCGARTALAWLKWVAVSSLLGGSTFEAVREQALLQLCDNRQAQLLTLSEAFTDADIQLISWCLSPLFKVAAGITTHTRRVEVHHWRIAELEQLAEQLVETMAARSSELHCSKLMLRWPGAS